MAGSNPGFVVDEFRTAIRTAMEMGMPTDTAQRLTFHWSRDQTFHPQDSVRRPYDFTQAAVTDVPGSPDQNPAGSAQVVYALEFAARPAGSLDTNLGEFDTSRAVVTILDVDWETINDPPPDYATIDEATYDIQFEGPPVGLFEATVYTLYLTARDEAGGN